MPSLSDVTIGAILLSFFGLFYYLAVLPTLRAIMALIGTILLAGVGFVGHILTVGAQWLDDAASWATGWLFGSHVPLIVALIITAIFIHDMLPKKNAGKRTGFAAIALGALIVAGATGIPALNHFSSDVHSGVNNARQITR